MKDYENINHSDNHVAQIKEIGEKLHEDIRNLEQIKHFTERNILPTFLQLVDADKTRQKELSQETTNENNLALVINGNREGNNALESKQVELNELEEKETALKINIEQITRKLKKLQSIQKKNMQSETRQKLITCRNFAKISKKLTGTNFEYSGPNVSGFITSKDKVQVFDLNPSKLNRQNISKHLWQHLETAADANWLDILDAK